MKDWWFDALYLLGEVTENRYEYEQNRVSAMHGSNYLD
jgi:hypothetical protein